MSLRLGKVPVDLYCNEWLAHVYSEFGSAKTNDAVIKLKLEHIVLTFET